MRHATAGTGPHVLREINRDLVLRILRSAEDPPRVIDLSQATGLSRPAVMRALADLGGAGLVESLDPADVAAPRIGRPAQRARFRAELGHVVGVDVGPHKILVKVADLAGRVVATRRLDVSDRTGGAEILAAAGDAIAGGIADVRTGAAACAPWAITVASPGLVSTGRGDVRLTPSMPGWAGLPIVDVLRERFDCPVLLEHDVTLSLVGERWLGVARDVDSAVFVQWGERIGASILINGVPYRGAHVAAGELGFLDVGTAGSGDTPLAAGGVGPFERLVGAQAILTLARAMSAADAGGALHRTLSLAGPDSGLPALFAAAAAGDPTATAIVDTVAHRFARGLAPLILLVDPQRVIIGGGVSRAGAPLLDAVRAAVAGRVLETPEITLSPLGEESVALGAVRHALDSVEDRLRV
ncbi:ROK family transcriptional regulator [Dactylosporangium maewongense]|uniref:ROK family transcriptional regulator n=1 Tax=Dactylosporangium maewongense TaxID=634393 RepID=A0ABN2B8F3_9ACTN